MRRTPLLLTAALAVTAAAAGPFVTASADAGKADPASYVFGVIGDVPYGADQVAAFPSWVDQISADPDVRFVAHVGDIKSGSSVCSDAYFDLIRAQLDRFDTPVVYTPGDNEWTDCHRPNNGAYDPYERLDALRTRFYPEPGVTLGARTMKVDAQPSHPENVDWHAARVTFTTAHVVGSNNGLGPWTGATEPDARQVAEVAARNEANIAQLREAFAEAERRRDRAVVVFQQADMFDPTWTPTFADVHGFKAWVQVLVDESRAFGRPVYLIDGDSHVYNVDRPLAAGSSWLDLYDVDGTADNLTRITVDGSSNNTDWLRVRVNRTGPEVLSWDQVPYATSTQPVAAARAADAPGAGAPYRLLQMNLCLSGLAGCFGGTAYPAVVEEAIAQVRATDPHAVTLNEACSGDAERIAAETGYHLTFATVVYRGAPLPCRNPGDRGVFGNAVLTKEQVRATADQPFAGQSGVEERRWTCVTTVRGVTVCTAHLSTRGSDGARAANDAQCAELSQVLAGFAASGPTVFAGDVNRYDGCAAPGMWTLTDAAAAQAPGIQHVYGSADLVEPVGEVVPATYTDHDFLLAHARLVPPGLR